jgi:hypothetical protein
MAKLGDEETKAREMLEEKMKLTQLLNTVNEDLNDGKLLANKGKEEIIKLRIKLS